MKVLIAEDNTAMQRVLKTLLKAWGYEPDVVADGLEAWNSFQRENPPMLGIIDWMMPGINGFDLIEMIQEKKEIRRPYIILLTSKNRKEDMVAGLNAGADDFISKPFQADELWARIKAGIRTLDLRRNLEENIRQLAEALSSVKRLQGLLPICAYCKKIRDGANYWHRVEQYIEEHTNAEFTHGICPDCFREQVASYDKGKLAPLKSQIARN
jgi:sigma-B regulation protein RsbU (phosphoserine phosphatase)